MKILVTGGAGFIGGNFVHYMLNKYPDYKILCLDKLTYAGNLETLKPVMDNPNFKFIKGDISDREFIYELFSEEKPDMVVNFAAESHVDRSIEDPGIFLKTNVIGTGVLMDACRKFGIERYHQVSTDEVYGDLPLERPDLFFTEETPIHASSPYSASKASADLLVQAYYRTYKLPVTISRCSNNYGPYHFPEKLIPLIITRALADEELPVYGTGENVRDWLYVEDHCSAIDLILHKGREGEVYNIGGHNERTNLQVVKTILKELGKPESLIRFVADRPGHDRRYAIDPTKIHNELGWLPATTFDEGIKKTIKWYLDNRKWWQHILSGEYKDYFKEKKISISKSVGMTENGFDYKEPKTKKSVRKVSIPDDIIPLLKQYHFEYMQTRFSHGTAWQGDLSNGGNLFIQADGKLMGHTTPYQYFTKHLHRYNEWVQNNPDKAKAEGLEELPIIPLHGLRHSCATLLNYLEVNIIEISKTLGHSTCSTTMNIYAHSFEEQQEEVATKVNEFLRLNA
ncbi:dTDP-glucose 4,6-dehydratase [Clostridium thermosuccinogenes]|nr:dTDP-glucose 4,6-dehydratase [Pseudoclostridium thermosuccinogenes]